MVFSSLFFVCLFLPLNLLIYKISGNIRARNIVMLVFSLIFYAWGDPICLLLLIGMTFADWLLALYISRCKAKSGRAKLGVFLMCIVNLGLLGVFKYGMFFLSGIKSLFGFPQVVPQILLPIGISFYTFQLISYVIDVYRGEVPAQKNFAKLLLYVSLFHQCIAGPIVRYSDVAAELEERRTTSTDVADGIWRFCIGLAKKSVLANTCGAVADTLLGTSGDFSNTATVALWVGMLAYSLQIYLDFSAYSDMAIGMGQMIGIHYLENFNYPYISGSVTEFWRRWHISLSTFFRDYVYIPLGGNRKGAVRTIFNLFIVWMLTGFWHGASWNFVLWGLYFFVFLIIEKLFLLKVLKHIKFFGHIYAILVAYFGWVLFRFEDFSQIIDVLKGIFGIGNNPFCNFETITTISSYVFILIISIIASTPLSKIIGNAVSYRSLNNKFFAVIYTVGRVLIPILLLLLSIATLVGNSYNPFLYFRF